LEEGSKEILPDREGWRTIIGLIFGGLVVWLIHGIMDYMYFYKGTFFEILVFDVPIHEIYHRVLVLAVFFTAGIFFKRREDELREGERKYRLLAENTTDVIFIQDMERNFKYVSPSVESQFGYTPEEALDMSIKDLMTPDSLERANESFKEFSSLAQKKTDLEVPLMQYEYIRKDGSTFWGELNVKFLCNHQGDLVGLQGTMRDVSERKKAEEERDEALRHFRTLFNMTVDPLFIVDNNGKILEATQRVQEAIGYTREELVGRYTAELEFLPSESKQALMQNLEKRLKGVDIPPYTIEIITKAGEKKPFEVNGEEMKYHGKLADMVALRDITARKRYEERLVALHGHATKLSEAESLEEIAEITLDLLQKVLGFKRQSFDVVKGEILKILMAEPPTKLVEMPLDGKGITVRAVNTGITQLVSDVRDDPDYLPGLADGEEPTLSELAVPVKTSGRVVAVINVESEIEDVFTEQDQKLVEILAEHVATNIGRIEARGREEEYDRNLEALHRSASSLSEASDSEEVSKIILYTIHDVLGYEYGGVGWIIEGKVTYDLIREDPVLDEWYIPLDESSITTRAVKTRRTQVVSDSREEPDFIETPFKEVDVPDMLSELAVPVVVENEAVAVINLEDPGVNAFNEQDEKLVETLAMHVSSALARIRRRENLEAMVEERTRELRESEEKYRKLAENSFDIILTFDTNGVVKYVSPSIKSILGYSSDEFVGENFEYISQDIFPEEARVNMLDSLRRGDMIKSLQFEVDDIGGNEVYLEANATPIMRNGELVEVEAIIRDVTERRRLREMKDQFVGMATHELRTPLVSIKGYVEYIQNGSAGEVPDRITELLDVVQRNTKRLSKITDDLLDQQRLESGEMDVEAEYLQISDLIEEVAEEAEPFLMEKDQALEIQVPDDISEVWADKSRISQVLINLLSNASKFSPESSTIRLEVSERDDAVMISVEDEGIGLTHKDKDKLFEPFPDIDRPTVTEKSTGLGLSICRGIVELHGGEIWAESEGKGKGSRFNFTLPKNS